MTRQEVRRQKALARIIEYMYDRSKMSYTLLYHAEDIAEETLTDTITLNGVPIYSVKNKPEYIRNRRLLLRTIRRQTELKPHKIKWANKKGATLV